MILTFVTIMALVTIDAMMSETPRPDSYGLTTRTSATLSGILTRGTIHVVGDGKWWTVSEAIARFTESGAPASDTTVRSYLAKGQLRGWYTGGKHARIEPASVDDLVPVLKMPLGEDREDAMAELIARNRGEPPTGD